MQILRSTTNEYTHSKRIGDVKTTKEIRTRTGLVKHIFEKEKRLPSRSS